MMSNRVVIVYSHKDHLELAQALKNAIEGVMEGVQVMVNNQLNGSLLSHLHIFVDLHHYVGRKLPGRFFVYNYQQLPCGRWKKFDRVKNQLKIARGIWDYSYSNMEMTFEKLGLSSTFVPFGYSPVFDFTSKFENLGGAREIDVLFIGEISERRTQIVNQIRKMGMIVAWPSRVDGPAKGKIILSAKIVLNLHKRGDLDILEIARLAFYLSNKSVVISEKSMDEQLMKEFEKGVIYADASEIPDLCVKMLSDEEKLDEMRESSYQWFKNDFNYQQHVPVAEIQKVLDETK